MSARYVARSGRQLDRLDQRRVVLVGLRAVDPLRYRPTLQIVIRRGLQLLDAHGAAQPMVELSGLLADGHAVVGLGNELIRLAEEPTTFARTELFSIWPVADISRYRQNSL